MADFSGYFSKAIQQAADDYAAALVAPVNEQLTAKQVALDKATSDLTTASAGFQTQLANLQTAYDAYRAANPVVVAATTPPIAVPVPPVSTVRQFSDFATSPNKAGIYYPDKGLVESSILEMKPKSSTKTAEVLALTSAVTNPFRLAWFGANSQAAAPKGIEIGNFTLRGSDQGHIYAGMMLAWSIAANVHDITIKGIPGLSSSPPTETGSLELWHADGAKLTNVVLDGRDAAGAPTAASLLMLNFTTGDTIIKKLTAIYAKYGFAAALWRCVGRHVFEDCVFGLGNRKGINIEQSNGGSYEFTRCDFRGIQAVPWVAQVSAIASPTISVPITFTDCIPSGSDGILKVRTYPGLTVGQKDSDIKCFVGGKDVTNDPTKFQILHAG